MILDLSKLIYTPMAPYCKTLNVSSKCAKVSFILTIIKILLSSVKYSQSIRVSLHSLNGTTYY
jgi:hypothetical protein